MGLSEWLRDRNESKLQALNKNCSDDFILRYQHLAKVCSKEEIERIKTRYGELTELQNEVRVNDPTPPFLEKTKRIIELELFFNNINEIVSSKRLEEELKTLEQGKTLLSEKLGEKGRGLFDSIKERIEKRYQQKVDALIKEMAFEIREVSDKNPAYFNVNNSIRKDVQLFEERIWVVREVFNKNKDKIENLCKKFPPAGKKFTEAETKFIRLEKLLFLLKKEKHNFSKEQMAELEKLEVNFYGKERLEKIKIMYNNFKAIELDKRRIRIEQERNEVTEQGILYIRELYPAMETDRRWTEEIKPDIAIAEFMNLQRNSLLGNKSVSRSTEKAESVQTTEGRGAGATGRRNLRQKGGKEREGH